MARCSSAWLGLTFAAFVATGYGCGNSTKKLSGLGNEVPNGSRSTVGAGPGPGSGGASTSSSSGIGHTTVGSGGSGGSGLGCHPGMAMDPACAGSECEVAHNLKVKACSDCVNIADTTGQCAGDVTTCMNDPLCAATVTCVGSAPNNLAIDACLGMLECDPSIGKQDYGQVLICLQEWCGVECASVMHEPCPFNCGTGGAGTGGSGGTGG